MSHDACCSGQTNPSAAESCCASAPGGEVVTRRIPLSQLRCGEIGRVLTNQLDPKDAAVLRAMGLRANAEVKLCRPGQPCIVSVVGTHGACCRIGLAAPLAQRVVVGVEGFPGVGSRLGDAGE
ncbi:MAG: FeoA family protein [Phycisphaerales bacterium]